ncbi:MAG: hypothetical protein J0J01_20885 [Reyranella sp.]|uniref:hypothetical protein n=1 Tax=Reyranella sp. TaxID=1929291 RepID=UPI001AD5AE51|nr:hypothetical protein [Reyranella sp.]MBN9089372.1 hypothetical protein [Reyranella sp.]
MLGTTIGVFKNFGWSMSRSLFLALHRWTIAMPAMLKQMICGGVAALMLVAGANADSPFDAFKDAARYLNRNTWQCQTERCSLEVPSLPQKLIVMPLKLGDGSQPTFEMTFDGTCGSAGCPRAIILKDATGWRVILEGRAFRYLQSKTNGFADIASIWKDYSGGGRERTTLFVWSGDIYKERSAGESADTVQGSIQQAQAASPIQADAGQACASKKIILTPSERSCDFAILNDETYVSRSAQYAGADYYNFGRLRFGATVLTTPLAQSQSPVGGRTQVTRAYLSPASPSGRFRYVTTFSGDLLLNQFLFDRESKELRITNAGKYASDGDSIQWSPNERYALLASRLEGFQLVHVLENSTGAHAHFPNWGRNDDPSRLLNMRMDEAFHWTGDNEFLLNAAICRYQPGTDCLKVLSTQQKRPTLFVVKDGPRIEQQTTLRGATAEPTKIADAQRQVVQAFQKQVRDAANHVLRRTTIVETWALQDWIDKVSDTGGVALFSYSASQGWKLVTMGGGDVGVSSLVSLGVPQSYAEQLVAARNAKQEPRNQDQLPEDESNFKGAKLWRHLQVGCGMPGGVNVQVRWFGNLPFDYNFVVTGFDSPNDRNRLLDPNFVAELVDHIKGEARKRCEESVRRRQAQGISDNWLVAFRNNQGLFLEFEALFKASENHWTIHNDYRDGILAQQAAQQAAEARRAAAEAERARQENERRLARSNFIEKFHVEGTTDDTNLGANPFQYRNKIVGVQTKFVRMLSESEAVFKLNTELLVGNVPTTRFRGNELVVLAVKVLGTKAVKTPNGEIVLPYGEYVGDFPCSQDCPFH